MLVQRQTSAPTMFQPHIHIMPAHSGATVKAAMATALGSSLALFHGVHNLSPHILAQARLEASSPSPSPSLHHARTKSMATIMGASASKPASSPTDNLARPPPQSSSPSRHNRSSKQHHEPAAPTTLYRLQLSCSTCLARDRMCSVAADLNLQWTLACGIDKTARGGQDGPLDWELEVDFCSPIEKLRRQPDRVTTLLSRYIVDRTNAYTFDEAGEGRKGFLEREQQKGKGVFRAKDLIDDLKGAGIKHISSIKLD